METREGPSSILLIVLAGLFNEADDAPAIPELNLTILISKFSCF